jgi:hypothetical protein
MAPEETATTIARHANRLLVIATFTAPPVKTTSEFLIRFITDPPSCLLSARRFPGGARCDACKSDVLLTHGGYPKPQICLLWFGRSFFLPSVVKSELAVEDDHTRRDFSSAILR